MTKQKTRSNLSVQYMTRIAILGALSAVLFPLEIPIVAFYKLDFSTLPALLGAFSMAFLDSFMNIFVTGSWYLQIVKGILFVIVVFLFTIGKRSKLLAR